MAIYFQMVFALLMAEMAVFLTLIIPLPLTVRRKLFIFISESPIISKIQFWMKILFFFVLVLFVDSVQRIYRLEQELNMARNEGRGSSAEAIGGPVRSEAQARRFYSQRNMYLTGFTLFLSLILNRTYIQILEVIRLEDEVKALKGESGGKDAAKISRAGEAGEVGKLKKELEAAHNDLAAMKKQHEGFQREYNRLGDEKAAADGTPKKER